MKPRTYQHKGRYFLSALLIAAMGELSGCQSTAGMATTASSNVRFEPESGLSIVENLPGQVKVQNPQDHIICYSINAASAPLLDGDGSCAVAAQRLPTSSIVELSECGLNTIRIAWRDGSTNYTTAASFNMIGKDCVDEAPFQSNARQWTALFQKDAGTPWGWSGGDAGKSLVLPSCIDCPADSRNRHLWMFGDSLTSTVDPDGIRPTIGYLWGNTIAVTGHSSASDVSANNIVFDWGANEGPWIPLLDEAILPQLSDLQIAMEGYIKLGFERQKTVANVFAESSLAPELKENLRPVYEYYKPGDTASYYTTRKVADGGHGTYKGIAFYVDSVQRGDNLSLYLYHSELLSDYLLSTSPDFAEADPSLGYAKRAWIGYVYAADRSVANTRPLTQYLRNLKNGSDLHHVYTPYANDKGQSVLMWPGAGIVIGKDLVQIQLPAFEEKQPTKRLYDITMNNLVSIVRGVDRPYADWGKPLADNWLGDAAHTPPQQYVLPHSDRETRWGYWLLKDKNYANNSYIYIYGVRRDEKHDRKSLVVARVASSDVNQFVKFENWRFYNGSSWVVSQDDAEPIMESNASHEFTIHRSPTGNYVLVQVSPTLKGIDFHQSALPTGPFKDSKRYYPLDTSEGELDDLEGGLTYYAINGHDGLSHGGDGSGLLISYIRSCLFVDEKKFTACPSAQDRADVYVPRFINLPWHAMER